jgi:dTDP-4-dehydrorhamnose reductase
VRVAIIGASGLVGGALIEAFGTSVVAATSFTQDAPGLTKLDMRSPHQIDSLLASSRPDVVLLPAANPNVDGCERDPVGTRAVNITGTANVANACRQHGCKLVFFSTDYVFDGRAGPYSEDAEPHPINEYARQKLEAEYIARKLPSYMIIRIANVFGPERQGKNFVYRVVRELGAGRELLLPNDQISTPTYAPDIAAAVRTLVERDTTGIWNVAGPEVMDRVSFAVQIASEWKLNASLLKGVPTADLGQTAPRPLRAGLTIKKLQAAGICMLPPAEALSTMHLRLSDKASGSGR